ncbi:molybdopterin-dependent oxidoreductase [Chloroflexota bacterium]
MDESEEKIICTTCASHCGGTCVLRVHVKDGVITRIESDDGEEPQLRACARGRAYRQRVYDPDRLKFPMKRVGSRGEGKFERISWEEALDTVAKELIRVRDTHGPASTVLAVGAGDINQIHNSRRHFHKVLCYLGGYTKLWGVWSYQGGIFSTTSTYGTWRTSNSRDDLLNSRFIILWGWNPANTICGTNTSWYLAQAREVGTKVVAVDPRYTDTVAVLANQWIPIIPGTDAAMLIAMAHVIMKENLQDRAFLHKYTTGFERFKDYVLGIDDGEAKTPAWAERITGVPVPTIENLAREYATARPAALMAGIAPGRTAYGEQYHRAASTLAAMTGNVGIHGGDAAGRAWESGSWYPFKMRYGSVTRAKDCTNPVEGNTVTDGRSPSYVPSPTSVHYVNSADFILKGKAGGYPADPKLFVIVNHNYVNQNPNINKIIQALKKLEFIVVVEQVMTATAKFADIILPTASFLERNDIDFGVGTPFYGFVNKAIEPIGECKTMIEITRELAIHAGITNFEYETEDEVLKDYVSDTEIPDYKEFRKKSIYRIPLSEPYVAFKKQFDDPANTPFGTPSGKIEIYSQTLAHFNNPKCPPVAQYIETWESRNDPLAKKYPLQLISTHFKRRTHGQFDRVPWLRELEPQTMLINTVDAEARDISNGDKVRVFNDRGEIIISAKVTERIIPGVVDVPQGAWYEPDEKGVDRGGNPNVLLRDEISPGGTFPYNTCLVQVRPRQSLHGGFSA